MLSACAEKRTRTRASSNSIGVLDIFGFEIFERNSFEQLCINYANEKLQQFFNHHVFQLEHKLYTDEHIEFSSVQYIDNQECVDLIDGKPSGILAMIDEEGTVPRGSDISLLEKFKTTFGGSSHRPNKRFLLRLKVETFGIDHYAGAVDYNVQGFVTKNKDSISDDLLDVMRSSTALKILGDFTSKKKSTLGGGFNVQLQALIAQLQKAEPHFVRCIKANQEKVPAKLTRSIVNLQLRYAGVFEAVKIRQSGFPFRLSFNQFFHKYRMASKTFRQVSTTSRSACVSLINELLPTMDTSKTLRIGLTMLLYKSPVHVALEDQRDTVVQPSTAVLARVSRGYIGRCRATRLRRCHVLLHVMDAT